MKDICEHCGHPEHAHFDERCLWCESERDMNPKLEVCPSFKPDIFNMWKDDDEGNRSPQSA